MSSTMVKKTPRCRHRHTIRESDTYESLRCIATNVAEFTLREDYDEKKSIVVNVNDPMLPKILASHFNAKSNWSKYRIQNIDRKIVSAMMEKRHIDDMKVLSKNMMTDLQEMRTKITMIDPIMSHNRIVDHMAKTCNDFEQMIMWMNHVMENKNTDQSQIDMMMLEKEMMIDALQNIKNLQE
jgi:hypothetical protein